MEYDDVIAVMGSLKDIINVASQLVLTGNYKKTDLQITVDVEWEVEK